MSNRKPPCHLKRILSGIGAAALAVVLMVVFYIAVIMGQPQSDAAGAVTPRTNQSLLRAMSSPILIRDENSMSHLMDAFPAPLMYPLYGTAIVFEQGLCADVPFEDGLGRTVTLTYRLEDGGVMTITSIYPARGLSIMGKGDYTISGITGPTLAGLRSVRMENAGTIRLHAQGYDALYVVTLPKMETAQVRQYTSGLQLFEGE